MAVLLVTDVAMKRYDDRVDTEVYDNHVISEGCGVGSGIGVTQKYL